MSLTGVSGLQISLFLDKLPDDPYTPNSAYHKDMVNSIRAVQVGTGRMVKYMTCGRDGTLRVWSAQTRRHITTVQDSSNKQPAWVTCCAELPNLTTPRNTSGVLAVFNLEPSMNIYDLNNFSRYFVFDLKTHVLTVEVHALRMKMHACIHIHAHACIDVHEYIHTYVHTYVMYVHTYVMYVHTYILSHQDKLRAAWSKPFPFIHTYIHTYT
jgi:hypothetical protein